MSAKRVDPAGYQLSSSHVPPSWGCPPDEPVFANLQGDYTYLTRGYYRSLDLEFQGSQVVPTTAECLDAYVVPIAMEIARAHGIATPESVLVTDRWPAAPLLAYPVNPFSSQGELLMDADAIAARRTGLTNTGKYPVYCQSLPPDYRIDVVRVVLGTSQVPEYQALAAACFEAFRLPLMKVRTIVSRDAYLFSGIEPLPFALLTPEEKAVVEEVGTWLA